MSVTRRNMIKLTAAGVAASTVPATCFAAAKRPGIALQLTSVRNKYNQFPSGLFGKALEDVAAGGWKAVEFAGYKEYMYNPEELKKKLDSTGLAVAGAQILADDLTDENIQKTIDFHGRIGCKNLIVVDDNRLIDPEQSKVYADLMNRAAAKLKPLGMRCGQHTHQRVFAKTRTGEQTYWDLFAERTSKDVILQLDPGWAILAKLDPAALIRKHPGRGKSVQCRPVTRGKPGGTFQWYIGQDHVPWKETLKACTEVGGAEWLVVHQPEIKRKDSFETAGISRAGLERILADLGM